MPQICKFFQQGNCRYGNSCWYEHPGPRQVGFQDTSFGTTQNRFATLGQNTGSRPQGQANPNVKDMAPNDILNLISQEMKIWEQSKMWPFSCYAYAKETPCIPGFRDLSPEEVRLEAYTAEKSGTFTNYKQGLTQVISNYRGERRQLEQMTPQMKEKLLEMIRNNKAGSGSNSNQGAFGQGSIFGSSGSAGGGLGSTPFGGAKGSTFGATPSSTSGSLFSTPAAAQSSGQGMFGEPSTFGSLGGQAKTALFQQNQSSTGFAVGSTSGGILTGQPKGSAFSTSSTAPTSTASGLFPQTTPATQTGGLFGKPAEQPAGGLFGKPPEQQVGLFGKPPEQQVGMFGKPPEQQIGMFGKPPEQQIGMFGKPPEQQIGMFGKPPEQVTGTSGKPAEQATGGLFGKAPEQPTGLFGKPPEQPTGLFGKPAEQPTGLFGKPAEQPTGLFGKPAEQPTGLFGKPAEQPSGLFGKGAPPAAVVDESKLYTRLDQLTPAEKEQFEAPAFVLGKIPTRPPPKELIT